MPDRTIRPSASLISLNNSSFGIFDFTTTVKPAFSRASTPCLDRLSLTRIFIPAAPILSSSALLDHQYFLCSSDSASKLNGMTQSFEHHFCCRQGRNDVKGIRIAHVRQPEDFALEMILSAGRRHSILRAEVLIDRLPVDAVRRADCGQGIARRLLRKQAIIRPP